LFNRHHDYFNVIFQFFSGNINEKAAKEVVINMTMQMVPREQLEDFQFHLPLCVQSLQQKENSFGLAVGARILTSIMN
jgi:hypothetical protein